MNLSALGWSSFFSTAFASYAAQDLIPGRITRQDKHTYLVHDGAVQRQASVLGKVMYAADDASALPAVGDWVAVQPFDDEQAVIHAVLPRFSAFYRKEAGQVTRKQVIAANIDTVFLVSGLDRDFNVRRIERYLVQASSSGAEPVILLNKADLRDDLEAVLQDVRAVAGEVAVVPLSATQETGLDALRAYIAPGTTVAFLGSSGVGKSSLVNALFGDAVQRVGRVREDDSRGRHTTTYRELRLLPGGGIVIDTPGLRELQLWGDEEDLQAVFADIEALAESCRFRDCSHETEPGCAVLQAIEEGDLDERRLQSYQKLKRELAFLNQRQDQAAFLQAKKREKAFGRMVKEIKKHRSRQ